MNAGLVFVAFGDKFVAEAVTAAASYREQMPDLPLALVTSGETCPPPAFDIVKRMAEPVVDFPACYAGYYQKILAIAETPFEVTLFVDSDTYCCAPVYDLFVAARHYGLAVVHAPYKMSSFGVTSPTQDRNVIPAVNTGVIAFSRDRVGRDFFENWSDLYRQQVPAVAGHNFSDQTVFRELLRRTGIAPHFMTYEYNARVGLPAVFHGPVRILHGRPRNGIDMIARSINASTDHRIYTAGAPMLILRHESGEWEIRGFPDGAQHGRVKYHELTAALENLGHD